MPEGWNFINARAIRKTSTSASTGATTQGSVAPRVPITQPRPAVREGAKSPEHDAEKRMDQKPQSEVGEEREDRHDKRAGETGERKDFEAARTRTPNDVIVSSPPLATITTIVIAMMAPRHCVKAIPPTDPHVIDYITSARGRGASTPPVPSNPHRSPISNRINNLRLPTSESSV